MITVRHDDQEIALESVEDARWALEGVLNSIDDGARGLDGTVATERRQGQAAEAGTGMGEPLAAGCHSGVVRKAESSGERRHGIVFLKKKDLIADSICHLAAGGQARYKGRLHQDRQRQL